MRILQNDYKVNDIRKIISNSEINSLSIHTGLVLS